MVTDPISDFIIRIKNAGAAGRENISVPFSSFVHEIAILLSKEGYVGSVERRGKKIKKFIDINLKYDANKRPEVVGAERISKLGKRVYVKSREIKPTRQGHGLMVISTPSGVMTDKAAKKAKVGGEALFKIW